MSSKDGVCCRLLANRAGVASRSSQTRSRVPAAAAAAKEPLLWAVKHVDLKAGRVVRLDTETTKNREARTFVPTAELRAQLESRLAARPTQAKILQVARGPLATVDVIRRESPGLPPNTRGASIAPTPLEAGRGQLDSVDRGDSSTSERPPVLPCERRDSFGAFHGLHENHRTAR
jgi:hypothetical protein